MQIKLIVKKEDDNLRLSSYLRKSGISTNVIKKAKMIDDGIMVNNIKTHTNYIVKQQDIVIINVYDTKIQLEKSTVIPQDIPIEIVYQDQYCMVINKPFGMPAHPSLNHPNNTLANAFCGYWHKIGEEKVCRIINRLDKDTSGLVLIALDMHSAEHFKKNLDKKYTAIVEGVLDKKRDIIEKNIARKGDSIITRCVSENGQWAKTEYNVVAQSDKMSLIDVKLYSGRTHQIRVHLAYIGHPLIGDDLYGGDTTILNRHALHCSSLKFITPTGDKKVVVSKLPIDMENLTTNLKYLATNIHIVE